MSTPADQLPPFCGSPGRPWVAVGHVGPNLRAAGRSSPCATERQAVSNVCRAGHFDLVVTYCHGLPHASHDTTR
jgi:hypothetical protein